MDLIRDPAALTALRGLCEPVQVAMARLAEGHRLLYREMRADAGSIPVTAVGNPLAGGL